MQEGWHNPPWKLLCWSIVDVAMGLLFCASMWTGGLIRGEFSARDGVSLRYSLLGLPHALFSGSVSGCIAFGLAYFLLRETDLRRAVPLIYGAVALEIIVVTPMRLVLGWFCSYAVLLVAMTYCRRPSRHRPRPL